MRTVISVAALIAAGAAQAADCGTRPAVYTASTLATMRIVDSGVDGKTGEAVYKAINAKGQPAFIHGLDNMRLLINAQAVPPKSVTMGRGTNNLPSSFIATPAGKGPAPNTLEERRVGYVNMQFTRCE